MILSVFLFLKQLKTSASIAVAKESKSGNSVNIQDVKIIFSNKVAKMKLILELKRNNAPTKLDSA